MPDPLAPVDLPEAPEPSELPVLEEALEAPPLSLEDERKNLYDVWSKDQTPEAASALLKSFDPLIRSQLSRFGNSIAMPSLHSKAKKYALKAFKTYDPTKDVKLSTHLYNQLNQLYREAYEASSSLRMSEELQSAMGEYANVYNELMDELGREPTVGEIRESTGWPQSKVTRLMAQQRFEVPSSALLYDASEEVSTPDDYRLDFVYNDLDPRDQKIFEWSTGYGGVPRLNKVEIARRLGVTPAVISQRAALIANKIQEVGGLSGD